jgi:predicted transcriptional regulator
MGRNMAEATFTFRVDGDLKVQFTEAARSHDRTGAQLLRDVMRDYVRRQQDEAEYDAWFRQRVNAGIESARAGRLIPAEEVEAEFTARRAATRHKLTKTKS